MHFPRMSSEVLMFPASFRRSPLFWVLAHRSEPARSHRHNLTTDTFIHIKDMRSLTQKANAVHSYSATNALLNFCRILFCTHADFFNACLVSQPYNYTPKPVFIYASKFQSFTHSLTVWTLGVPISSILNMRMEKIL